ncbi:MAG: peptide deformylase [bacterium]|nr:peptide deformylase [bacterium]
MTIRPILTYPQQQAALRKPSDPVARMSAEVEALIQDMKDSLASQPGAGLSAVQIGVHQRISLMCFGQDEGEIQPPLVVINPKITQVGPPAKGFDGCLSIPKLVTWDTLRPSWLVFTGRDEHWKTIRLKVEGIDARVVSHEIDHLDGKLFLDLLTPTSKLYLPQTDANGEEKLVEVTSMIGQTRYLK